uniref:NADH-ubiquinone oxidoreductase chain 3 n=1 Tax=Pandinus cavimanus TaxID=217261 RepID=H2CYR2_PANCV|nr:NADH dehydrogenase-like subunit 3 [Pandinus cavimanus]
MMIGVVLSRRVVVDRERGSSFECGFEPFNSSRLSFSLQFFLIGIIFLIFDVEVALLPPVPLCYGGVIYFFITFFFVLFLLFGLYFEWIQGTLEWLR